MYHSVFDIFKIGLGPSSSHTVGPMKAAKAFLMNLKSKGIFLPEKFSAIQTNLYGSLALTGEGHGTDKAILLGLMGESPESVHIESIGERIQNIRENQKIKLLNEFYKPFIEKDHLQFKKHERLPFHTNGMKFTALCNDQTPLYEEIFYSVGGGFIVSAYDISDQKLSKANETQTVVPYSFSTCNELLQLCKTHNMSIAEMMLQNEKVYNNEHDIYMKLDEIWRIMQECVKRGCSIEGYLPGGLNLKRRAPALFKQVDHSIKDFTSPLGYFDWVNVYAIAVCEENAAGGRIVTAPTNGAAGIIPAVLHYYDKFHSNEYPNKMPDFLLTAAAIGILFKENATISGAEGGCQGEVGSACSMAAAGLTAALGGSMGQIENAAEIAMEHNLGLTCDPVAGLVQIPCIERNTMGAIKAINACALALKGSGEDHKVSLDDVIKVMKETGDDMKTKYKETSKGGLAKQMNKEKIMQKLGIHVGSTSC